MSDDAFKRAAAARGILGGTPADEASRRRATRRPGGRRTTVTLPDALDRSLLAMSAALGVPANELLVALASHSSQLLSQDVARAHELADRREAVRALLGSGDPARGEYPSDEEMDEAMREARGG
jgi:hypothetical protein